MRRESEGRRGALVAIGVSKGCSSLDSLDEALNGIATEGCGRGRTGLLLPMGSTTREAVGDWGRGIATATGTEGSWNGLSSSSAVGDGPREDGLVDVGVMRG